MAVKPRTWRTTGLDQLTAKNDDKGDLYWFARHKDHSKTITERVNLSNFKRRRKVKITLAKVNLPPLPDDE